MNLRIFLNDILSNEYVFHNYNTINNNNYSLIATVNNNSNSSCLRVVVIAICMPLGTITTEQAVAT